MATRKSFALPVLFALLGISATAAAQPGTSTSKRPALVAGGGSTQAGYIRVGNEGAEWSLPGHAKIRAAAGSELRVLSTPQSLTLAGGRQAAGYTVIVRSGRIDVDVPDKCPSAVVLAMPRQTSAIVESGNLIAVAGSGRVAIGNVRGATSVATAAGAFRQLPTGSLIESNGKQRALIGAPTRIAGTRVWMSAAIGEDRGHDLAWDDVAGSVGYRVELKDSRGGRVVGSASTREARVSDAFKGTTAGEYSVSVYSLDESGIESPAPYTAPVRVVGTELPEGAYVDSKGTVRLGKAQQVQFTGTRGLEVTYGASGRFFKAPNHVGLFRNDDTLVHFRFPGTFETSTVRLKPRTVIAEVEVGPKTVTWPEKPVEIRIRLKDTTGEPVPEWLEAKPTVLLGVRPVDVSFRKDKGWLTAKVAPRGGGGPWVMRVEVSDQFGMPLGRDHVEIVRGPNKQRIATTTTIHKRADRLSSR